MFDLFRSRAKAVRILLGGLLLIIAVSMVITLIPGYGTGGTAQDQVIADIGKESLTTREVQQQLQALVRNRSIPAAAAGIYARQLLDDMISTRALVYEAKRQGLTVSDTDLAQALRVVLPQLFPNGQFVGKEVYASFLAQQNLTIPEFESQLRQQLLISRLTGLVNDAVIVTPDEIAREYQRRNDKVKLEYVAISPAKYKSEVTVTPDEVQKFYQTAKAQFRIPEKRSFDMLVADEAKIGQAVTIPDEQLLRIYNQNKDQYRMPERVHVRHILLKTTDKPKDEIPKIQAKAEALLAELKKGTDFAQLATKNSEDPGSAAKGGDLGWIVRGQTVPAFESAAFSLKPKELSGVIKTEYGFHIIQVLEKEPARVKSFEEVKDQIAQEAKRQQVFDRMQQSIDRAHDQLVKTPLQAPQIASQLGLELIRVDKMGPGDAVPDFGKNPDFSDAIMSLQKGGVTPVMQAPGNKLAVAAVTEVVPARGAELSEVEGQIRDRLLNQKLQELVTRRAAEAGDKAKALNGDLNKLASQMGLEVKSTQDFNQDGAADGIGPANMLQPAFVQPVGGVFGPVSVGGQFFVCKVANRIPADMSQLPAQRAAIQNELKTNKGRERLELFTDSIRAALINQGKIKIHEQVLERLLTSYRG